MAMTTYKPESPWSDPTYRSSSQCKREQKRRPKPKDGTLLFCGVCGDRALGYNFDAVSCESCKAFFRRNALKTKPFTCSFDGNCKIDPHTRKFCSGCRLKKCFTVGMKKEWILNEDQLVKRRQRQQTRQGPSCSSSGPDVQPCSSTSSDLLGEDSSMQYMPREYQPSSQPHLQHLQPSSTCHSGSDSNDYLPLTPIAYYDSCSSTASSPLKRHYSISFGSSCSPTSTTSPPVHIPQHIPAPPSAQPASNIQFEATTKTTKMDYTSTPIQQTSNIQYEASDKVIKMDYNSTPIQQTSNIQYEASAKATKMDYTPTSIQQPSNIQYEASDKVIKMDYTSTPIQLTSNIQYEATTKVTKLDYTSEDEDCYYGSITQVPAVTPFCDPTGPCPDFSKASLVKYEMVDDEDYVIPLDPGITDNLQQLAKTYDEIFEAAYTPDQISKLTAKPKTANQLFNMTDVFIRRLIRFAKHVPEFKNLSQADQIHLLKGGIMEMFVLRSAMGFDSKHNAWKFKVQQSSAPEAVKVEGKLDSSIINTLSSSMFMQHIEFVRQLQEDSGKDRTVLMLLFIIDLMSPDRANLSDKLKVSQSQERHSMWLKAYLESVHTVSEVKVMYPKLLVKLLDVRNLAEESCQMASHLDITNLEPLLVEVFDLNR